MNPDMPIEGMNRKTYRTKKFGIWERSLAVDGDVAATVRSLGIAWGRMRPNAVLNPIRTVLLS